MKHFEAHLHWRLLYDDNVCIFIAATFVRGDIASVNETFWGHLHWRLLYDNDVSVFIAATFVRGDIASVNETLGRIKGRKLIVQIFIA